MRNKEESEGSNWYAVRTRSNFEKIASSAVENRGFRTLSPTYKIRKRLSDRVREVEKPLFPGYIFSYFDPAKRLPILTAPGIIDFISFAGTLLPLEPSEIEAIRAIVESGLAATPVPYLNVGQRVMIESGPLTGVSGILTQIKSGCRVVCSVDLLHRSIAVEVQADWVFPVCNAFAPLPFPRAAVAYQSV